jgi:SNF2 family DNA or RNA helicase
LKLPQNRHTTKNQQNQKTKTTAADAEEAAGLTREEYLLLTSRLHTVLRPFVLRRLKEAVAGELPAKVLCGEFVMTVGVGGAFWQRGLKGERGRVCVCCVAPPFNSTNTNTPPPSQKKQTEVVVRCAMGPYQAALYALVAAKLGRGGGDKGGKGGGGTGGTGELGISVNNALMELRTICNGPLLSRLHPELGEALLPRSPLGLPPEVRLGSKLEALDRVLVRLAAGKHKVCVCG